MDTGRRPGNPRRLLFHPVIAGRVATGDRNLPTAEDAGRRSCYPALIANRPSDPASALLRRSIWRPLPAGRVALDGPFPALNGAKLRQFGMVLRPEGTRGFSPGFQPWERGPFDDAPCKGARFLSPNWSIISKPVRARSSKAKCTMDSAGKTATVRFPLANPPANQFFHTSRTRKSIIAG